MALLYRRRFRRVRRPKRFVWTGTGVTAHTVTPTDSVALSDARAFEWGLRLGSSLFGDEAQGPLTSLLTANTKQVVQLTTTKPLLLEYVLCFVSAVETGQAQAIRGVIYTDSAGSPGALVASTAETILTDASIVGLVRLGFTSRPMLAAGTYWVGLHAGGPDSEAIHFYRDNVASSRKLNADTYSDGPTDPFGTVDTTDNIKISIAVRGGDGVSLADSPALLTDVGGYTVEINDAVVASDGGYGSGMYGEGEYGSSETRITFVFGKSVADSLVLTDLFSRVASYGRSPADGISLTDQRLDAQGIRLADVVALADVLSRVSVSLRGIADSVTVSDNLDATEAGAGQVNPSDFIALSDSFTRIATYARSVADAVAVTDSVTTLRGRSVSIADAVAVTDFFSRLATYTRTPADALALTDLLSPGALKPLSLADVVLLSDAQSIFNGIITAMLDPIYTGHIGMGWTGGISDPAHGDAQDGIGEEQNGHIGNGHNGGLALVTSGGPEEDDQE